MPIELHRFGVKLFLLLLVFFAQIGRSVAQETNLTKPSAPALNGYEISFPAMGSVFQISAYTDDEAKLSKVAAEIETEVNRLNSIFSDYDPNSELERWLASTDQANFVMSTELFEILELSESWYLKSGHLFDPAIGCLTHLWRGKRRAQTIPSKQEIDEALKHSGWQHIEIIHDSNRVIVDDRELKVDLGGIATGYTVDRCFKMLHEAGIDVCLVNSGGDIRCGEAPPDRDGWKIEVAPIERDKEALKQIVVANCSVTTSGDLWRFTLVDGVRRSHIVDPRTGYGITGPTSVTVIGETCLEVDVLATTLSLMGPEEGMKFLQQQFPGRQAFFAWKTTDDQLQTQASDHFGD
jgi:FAD:protein FMN transferase